MLSASIAPVPIATDLSHMVAPRPRVETSETVQVRPELDSGTPLPNAHTAARKTRGAADDMAEPEAEPARREPQPAPEKDPLPPGAMFAAAIIAGQLSPKPESLEEVFLRAGISWTPPDSGLRLADKTV